MKIDRQAVEKVARLARLALSDDDIAVYQGQLSSILGYIEQLDEVDTADVPPTAQVTGLVNVLADDEIKNERRDKLPVDVPASDGTSIKVKGVFGG
ncbi:MAG: Asp-tRNA(Asn)/Glu-tRNA(Gln) amidotransferase subunit GatC [bacterium]|nr:Asp-tRNA(Asn)/Glu-tRNA(Gln) amidotransferase subunit GatC [bacterium]MDZ4247921.1 Asp-tRNA(Asn)/Glu-tRNA(Gln) amidotransferase subunit GatC [Patescibacteria group bacterium]